jgi:enoyl-CoA hydratase/carnithine racemase
LTHDYETIRFARHDGVATITLNRPEQRNALNLAMCDDLLAAFAELRSDAESRVVLLRGAGPVFCAGADLREREGRTPEWVRERRRRAFAAYAAIVACELPCIAVLHGAAIGSACEIALCCDFVIASTEASFRWPEIGWGTVGATQRLPRRVGPALAKELIFTGRKVEAEEAVRIGLANRAVPPDRLDAAVAEIARAIAQAPPLAMRLSKRCIDMGAETDLARGVEIEMMAIERALADREWREGVKAFGATVGGKKP